MTATVTPITHRRSSASLTGDPLLLNTERLHRVDARQLPPGAGVSLGYCRTDMGICMGHPECTDTSCAGHPCNDDGFDVPEHERDAALLRRVLVLYVAFIGACSWATWELAQLLSRH